MNGIRKARGVAKAAALAAATLVGVGGAAAAPGGATTGRPTAVAGDVSAARAALRLPAGYVRGECGCTETEVFSEPRDSDLACEIGRIACRSAETIAAGIGLERIAPVAIAVAHDEVAFARLHEGRLPEWGEAFADPVRMLIGIDAARVVAAPRPLRTVVLHELSHLFFEQRTRGARAPTWLLEGVAMRQSGEWTLEDEWSLALSLWRGDLPDLEDLGGPFPRPAEQAAMAYRLSHAAVDRLLGERPESIITLTAFLRDSGDFERAFLLTFGESQADYAARFHASLEARYRRAGILLHTTPYWLSVAAMFLLVYGIKRYRVRRKLAAWEREENG